MANSTKLHNSRVANIGSVKITSSDNSEISHTITSLDTGDASSSGTFFDQNSSRTPTQVDALGQSWKVNELPGTVNYGSGVTGQIRNGSITNESTDIRG